jgi:hypothetical protein
MPLWLPLTTRQAVALKDLLNDATRIDAGSVASQFKSLWSLYHLDPDSYYTSYTIEVCSERGRKLFVDRLLEKEVGDLWNLFYKTEEKQAPLRGIRFEAYAHKKISTQGIDGTAHLLTKEAISATTTKRVVVPAGSILVDMPDNNLDSLSQRCAAAVDKSFPQGTYFLPSLPNFPVIDSAYVGPEGVIMFQMKTGRSKPLSQMADSVCRALGNFFVVVVPADNVITKKLPGGPENMKQYVLVVNESPH